MKADRRWWNEGRYEQECAAFDAAAPLSRETWESLQRDRREQFRRMACEPADIPYTDSINAVTEGGLAIRVKLLVQFPMHCGVAYL